MHLLTSTDPLTAKAHHAGAYSWEELVDLVQTLPYGRNSNRQDLGLVIREQRGTCSSKHAFLKKIADLNGIEEVELILAIYKMDRENTPGIGDALESSGLKYIPEAHTYLKVQGTPLDVTSTLSDLELIAPFIIHEEVINPEDVADVKVRKHKAFIHQWIEKNQLSFFLEEIWEIRERCIEMLES